MFDTPKSDPPSNLKATNSSILSLILKPVRQQNHSKPPVLRPHASPSSTMQPLSLDDDGSSQANQNQPDSGSPDRAPFGFDLQDTGRAAVFHPSSNDVVTFQASPWLFDSENSGFRASVTTGSTTNLFLPGAYSDSLDIQAGLKSSDQDFGFEIPLPNNDWNSFGNLESQSWAVSIPTTVPSHAITRPVTFDNNYMDIGFVPNSYVKASNVPAIGLHSLGFSSIDVGQASLEMLKPASDNSQELVIGTGRMFLNPTVYQGLLQNDSVSSPNGHNFDTVGSQHVQVPQGQAQASQDDGQALSGPTVILGQPNPVNHHIFRVSTFACAHGNCNQAFKRKSDLARHRKAVHGINHIKFFCHIPGCPKGRGHGEGYSRDDKLIEHLWKKHGNLGYTKSR